jgi:alanine dehydrogenase
MLIGIPKEIKKKEFRVGLTPQAVKTLVDAGHVVHVQKDAAKEIGFTNELYEKNGAKIVESAKEVYKCEMIIKVKEPQKEEFPLLHEGQVLFCYLHLAPDPEQTKQLLSKKIVGIAFETITDDRGGLPLLIPMSEVAGKLSIQVGATALQLNNGGKGVLLGGIPGVRSGRVVVLGGGIVGTEALKTAIGIGAEVTVIDKNLNRLRELDALYSPALKTIYSTKANIEEAIAHADLVIGAVLIPGAKAPKLITKDMLKLMEKGSVLVDVAIDQGGCFETSKATSHEDPTYVVDGIIHYCVANMPGACARTSTQGLTNAILPYALKIASGWKDALKKDKHLMMGLNVCMGKVTNEPVAQALGYDFVSPDHCMK